MEGHPEEPPPRELGRWLSSGLLALTGSQEELAAPPRGLVGGLDALEERLRRSLEARGGLLETSWEELVLGRAALRGLRRAGRRSANGSCRLVAAADGWVAINLARPEDFELLPALFEQPLDGDLDRALGEALSRRRSAEVVERGRLLGLAVARLMPPAGGQPVRARSVGPAARRSPEDPIEVVDLSGLWAGPLCAHLLGLAGARVLKVESAQRPDGARQDPAFYRWLHPDSQPAVTLDFSSAGDLATLRSLLEGADVVLESSRPRALVQLGLGPDQLDLREGAVWLSITGHGREASPMAVAFGDDAAVAGGLVGIDSAGEPVFCGDAIADPITGMLGAAACLEALDSGGGVLLDLAMSRAAGSLLELEPWWRPEGWTLERRGEVELLDLGGAQLELGVPHPPASLWASTR
jgi:crotonobetainyl-CoA:carnitine CoA-transferase CaiB-like acyl-CoA transferase